MQDLQVDKRNSNNSFSSKRTSLRISTATINSDTAIPPPVHFTTTINDPPMPVRRNSSRSKYYQRSIKNLNYPFETKSINLDENYSLLDNLSLYDKIFNADSFNNVDVNGNNQKEKEKEKEKENKNIAGNMEELKHLNPLLNPYDTSWVPEPYSSSPILSKFSLLDSNKSNLSSNLDNNNNNTNNRKKVRFITHSSNLSQIDESQVDESQESQIDESQLQYASSSGSEDNNYVNNDLNASEKGEEYKSNKLNSWKKLWEMPWRDVETKKITKKFWLTFLLIIFLILIAVIIGICLRSKSIHQMLPNNAKQK
ncbi:unnamed protein product [Rhizophagus irregularis]|nr:unnamed protein product [Rhizophagus irregularis]